MTRRNRNARQFDVETLEGRKLLAGNVTATLQGGNLYVTGDAYPNSVEVRSEGGFLLVSNPGGTTNNNPWASGAKFALSQLTRNVVIDMNQPGRGDSVTVKTLSVPLDLTINTGNGHDFVTLEHVRVGDDLTVDTRGGNDAVFLRNVRVGFAGIDGNRNDVAIATGDGHDTVNLYRTEIRGELTVATDPLFGSGNDVVEITQSQLFKSMDLRTEGGNDSVTLFSVDVADSATINTGAGSDAVDIYSTTIGELLTVDMGSGDYDWLRIFSSRAKRATLLGGVGIGDYLALNNFVTDFAPQINGFEQTGQW